MLMKLCYGDFYRVEQIDTNYSYNAVSATADFM